MTKKLYVGNLGFGTTEPEISELFSAHGTVASAELIMDRETGQSKGYAFVEMGSDREADAAIGALNGHELKGRVIKVNEAKPRPMAEDRRRR